MIPLVLIILALFTYTITADDQDTFFQSNQLIYNTSPTPITGIIILIPGHIPAESRHSPYIYRAALFMKGLQYHLSPNTITMLTTNTSDWNQLNEMSSTHSHLIFFGNEKFLVHLFCLNELWNIIQKYQHRSYYAFHFDRIHINPLSNDEKPHNVQHFCENRKTLPENVRYIYSYQLFHTIMTRLLINSDYSKFLIPQTHTVYVPLPIQATTSTFNKATDKLSILIDIPTTIATNRPTAASFACEIFSKAFRLYEDKRKDNNSLLPLEIILTHSMPSHIPPLPNQVIHKYMSREKFVGFLESSHIYATAFRHAEESSVLGIAVHRLYFSLTVFFQMLSRMVHSSCLLLIMSSRNYILSTIPSPVTMPNELSSESYISSPRGAYLEQMTWLQKYLSGCTRTMLLRLRRSTICMGWTTSK